MHTNAAEKYALNVKRLVQAPPDRVFAAWTTPSDIVRWFAHDGWRLTSAAIDPRVGGEYCLRSQHDQYGDNAATGIFREVQPPARLVFTWNWAASPLREIGETQVTLDFVPSDGATEVRLRHEGFPSAEIRDQHAHAWNALLDALAQTQLSSPFPPGLRVYAIGHSFQFALPPIIAEVAQSAGIVGHQIAGVSNIGGAQVIQHWTEPNIAPLRAGQADVVTLTPIYLPDDGIEKFAQLSLESPAPFRVTMQEFWLPFDTYEPHYYHLEPKIPAPEKVDHNAATVAGLRQMHARYFDEMDALVSAINQKLGKPVVFVVPMGQAVIALREKILAGEAPSLHTQEDLFADPLGHPTAPMLALEAYVHFAVIYRRTPVGLPVPEVLRAAAGLANESLNGLLQNLAWEAVTQHPLSGVGGATSAPGKMHD